MSSERLSKFLAACGVASRRKCEEIIKEGRVKINNVKAIDPHSKLDPQSDIITLDNHTVNPNTLLYIALYKPRGYLSDLAYNDDRKLARNLIPINVYLFPVGRLDYHSEGLIIFTNDGDFAHVVMHPNYGTEKEYLVKFRGQLTNEVLIRLQKGIMLEHHLHRVDSIRFLKPSLTNNWYRVILTEGRNRMIRRLGDYIGHPVLKLKRIRIGPVKLGSLAPGEYRFLTAQELKRIIRPGNVLGCNSITDRTKLT